MSQEDFTTEVWTPFQDTFRNILATRPADFENLCVRLQDIMLGQHNHGEGKDQANGALDMFGSLGPGSESSDDEDAAVKPQAMPMRAATTQAKPNKWTAYEDDIAAVMQAQVTLKNIKKQGAFVPQDNSSNNIPSEPAVAVPVPEPAENKVAVPETIPQIETQVAQEEEIEEPQEHEV